MQPTALVRVDGTVVGVRTVEIPAVRDADGNETRPARSWLAVDVASDYASYNGRTDADVTGYLLVQAWSTPAREAVAKLGAGERVSMLCEPVVAWMNTRAGNRSYASLRFVGLAEAKNAGNLRPVGAAAGS